MVHKSTSIIDKPINLSKHPTGGHKRITDENKGQVRICKKKEKKFFSHMAQCLEYFLV